MSEWCGSDSTGDEKRNTRLFMPNFLMLDQCEELEFIHKSRCAVGYRPHVFSTKLSHVAATNSAHLIAPIVSIKESLKKTVESFFRCEFELCIEFTGLIRAVCYLNSYGIDFEGGLFHVQDGEPEMVAPSAGDVLIYTADSRNVHSVAEITMGERLTLMLWFSRDGSHDEDAKLISHLSRILPRQVNGVSITSIVI